MAGRIDTRLNELGLTLPASPKLPPGVTISFEWVRVRGHRAFVSGHGPLEPDGTPAGPFGKVPSEVPLEAAQESARLTALAVLAGLKQVIGDLDRIVGWRMVNGFVNADLARRRRPSCSIPSPTSSWSCSAMTSERTPELRSGSRRFRSSCHSSCLQRSRCRNARADGTAWMRRRGCRSCEHRRSAPPGAGDREVASRSERSSKICRLRWSRRAWVRNRAMRELRMLLCAPAGHRSAHG